MIIACKRLYTKYHTAVAQPDSRQFSSSVHNSHPEKLPPSVDLSQIPDGNLSELP